MEAGFVNYSGSQARVKETVFKRPALPVLMKIQVHQVSSGEYPCFYIFGLSSVLQA